MTLKSRFAALCFVAAVTFAPVIVKAQPGGGGPDPDPGTGTSVPFDGGITMLIAAGIGYAAKKRYDKRKEQQVAVEKD